MTAYRPKPGDEVTITFVVKDTIISNESFIEFVDVNNKCLWFYRKDIRVRRPRGRLRRWLGI